jgi:hypothetical protein
MEGAVRLQSDKGRFKGKHLSKKKLYRRKNVPIRVPRPNHPNHTQRTRQLPYIQITLSGETAFLWQLQSVKRKVVEILLPAEEETRHFSRAASDDP